MSVEIIKIFDWNLVIIIFMLSMLYYGSLMLALGHLRKNGVVRVCCELLVMWSRICNIVTSLTRVCEAMFVIKYLVSKKKEKKRYGKDEG